MVPPDERLEANGSRAGERHDGLVVDADLLARDGVLQRRRKLMLAANARVHLRLVYGVLTLAARLRAVHRDIGMGQQLACGSCARGAACDPDARVDARLVTVEYERGPHGVDEPGRDQFRLLVRRSIQQNPELVAAETRGDVAESQARPYPLRHCDEQLVAGVVAERVVDRLEIVEVDEQHRGRKVVGRRPCSKCACPTAR